MTAEDGLLLRPAQPRDEVAIRALVASQMGWGADAGARRMWEWKHDANPFGTSPRWVAEDGDRVVAVRVFLRWEFDSTSEGLLRAVRAVDTVTAPEYRGRGLFRRLTLQALDDLTREGVRFVFNTPNGQSRPGYLKMGWEPRGRVPVVVLPAGVVGGRRMVRSRVPAELSSLPCEAGFAAQDGLDDTVVRLLGRGLAGVATRRSADYLRWRYAGLPDLRYRVLHLGQDPADGVCVVRVRRRGTATEAAVVESFAPSLRQRVRLTTAVARQTGASHVLAVPHATGAAGIPVPALGPELTVRRVTGEPPQGLELSLGDVELF